MFSVCINQSHFYLAGRVKKKKKKKQGRKYPGVFLAPFLVRGSIFLLSEFLFQELGPLLTSSSHFEVMYKLWIFYTFSF